MVFKEEIMLVILIIILIIAVISDIRSHKIPNALTFPSVMFAIVYHTSTNGIEGLLFSLGGLAIGMGTMTIPYVMGGTGAGDVKLMGAIGGFLGPKGVIWAFIATSIIGGIYALAVLIVYGYLRKALGRYGGIIKTFFLTKKIIYIPPSKGEKKPKLCYGIAIAFGTLISVFWGIGI